MTRLIRCKTEGCDWSCPAFYRVGRSTRSGWAAYAEHLLGMEDQGDGHPKLTIKQLERIRRGWEPGRAQAPAEEA